MAAKRYATQVTGKQGEYRIIGKLLAKNMDVYIPVVDIEQIDCLVRNKTGEYSEVQIKTRTDPIKHTVFEVRGFRARPHFFVVCHYLLSDESFVVPSVIFKKLSVQNGKYRRIYMTKNIKENLAKYREAYHLLEVG